MATVASSRLLVFYFSACLNPRFRAGLAYLASGKARHVKTTKKALKHYAARLELPKLGERGAVCSALFLRSHTFQSKIPTANSPQPTANRPPQLCLVTARDCCCWRVSRYPLRDGTSGNFGCRAVHYSGRYLSDRYVTRITPLSSFAVSCQVCPHARLSEQFFVVPKLDNKYVRSLVRTSVSPKTQVCAVPKEKCSYKSNWLVKWWFVSRDECAVQTRHR